MNAGKCLERAEKIKAAKKDVLPVVRDPFSEGETLFDFVRALNCIFMLLSIEEQSYILDKSSRLNELRYPAWRAGKSISVG